jgi:hypothetical protein
VAAARQVADHDLARADAAVRVVRVAADRAGLADVQVAVVHGHVGRRFEPVEQWRRRLRRGIDRAIRTRVAVDAPAPGVGNEQIASVVELHEARALQSRRDLRDAEPGRQTDPAVQSSRRQVWIRRRGVADDHLQPADLGRHVLRKDHQQGQECDEHDRV